MPFNPYKRYDIVVPELMLICEFDGPQHFKYIEHFHKTKEGFEHYKENDRQKIAMAEAHGYKVIHFSYVEKIDDPNYVRCKLNLRGIHL